MVIFASVFNSGDLWYGKDGEVSLKSDAPLELIQAGCEELEGYLRTTDNSFAFRMHTICFEGFNSSLQQEHFHENYLESDQYPTTSFTGKFIEDIRTLGNGDHDVRAKGELEIHGVSAERIVRCHLNIANDKIILNSQFIVPLAEHDIRIPQVVHQKIAEEIEVQVKIELTPR